MVVCQKAGTQKIMPIFYDVAPLDVRHQTKDYKKAFSSHKNKKRHDEKTIQEWKDALIAVARINGWDLQSMSKRQEGEFARKVTHEVFGELKKAYLVILEHLVSVDNHIDTLMEIIGVGTSETRIIGIHGMGGIGKTTIAKLIYNKLLQDFENYCFLRDIRETSKGGIQCLQNQLISDILKTKFIDIKNIGEGTQTIKDRLRNKRVLLLLDDVEEDNHIDALVGKRDCLGKGSKIIITTRNKDILNVREVDHSYELHHMDPDRSLQLFSKHAFRRDSPLDEDMLQSHRAIGIARGLPLTLEVLGSLLGQTEKKKWDLMLKKLEGVPHKTVWSKLKISYDALDDRRQQHIFLDITCLFIGYDKNIIVHFWDESKFPEEAMEVLQNRSLIKIEKSNRVWMHDQLRDLGREIVRRESEMKIEKQSRVWDTKEALDLLRRPEGKKEVEALCLKFGPERQFRFTYEGFKSLPNLRFLQVDCWRKYFDAEERLFWHESPLNVLPTNVFPENSDLLPLLRWLAWHDIPPTFKIMNFSMENVVILDLSISSITYDWEGWSHMKVMKNLKVLDLHSCFNLKRTPNFSTLSNLERLTLQQCYKLDEIDESICQLKSLVFLDVSHCRDLRRLPNTIGNLELLIELDMLNTGIKELPNSIGNLKLLNKLNISRMGIQELPHSIGNLESLIELDISYSEIKELPHSIGNLESLMELDIFQSKIKELPNSIRNLKLLNKLNISRMGIKELPHSIGYLYSLMELDISNTKIKELPDSIGSLESLIKLDISSTEIEEVPDSIGKLKNLKVVKMNWCFLRKIPNALWMIEKLEVIEAIIGICHFGVEIGNHIYRNQSMRILKLIRGRIYVVPRLLESLTVLRLSNLYMNTFPDLSNLTNLKELELWFVRRDYDGESEGESDGLVEEDPMPLRIGSLHGESDGESDGPMEKDLPRSIGNLSKLESLILKSPYMTALPTYISLLPHLKSLKLWCPNLGCLPSLPSSLSKLDLQSECVAALSTDMSSLIPRLKRLTLHCPNLRCLRSLPSILSELNLQSKCVTTLPTDMSSLLPQLRLLLLKCPNLRCLRSLPSSLSSLYLYDCMSGCSMEGEDLSNLKTLSTLFIKGCAISEIRGLDCLENLQQLRLTVSDCGNLVEIQGRLPPSLCILEIRRCGSLQKLPDLSSLKGLREVEIKGCGKLNVEAISSLCSEKGVEFEGDDSESGCEFGYGSEGEDRRISACCS